MDNMFAILRDAILKALENPELKKDYITWKEGRTHNDLRTTKESK